MAKYTLVGNGSAAEIAEYLADQIQASGISCELVDSAAHSWGDFSSRVLVFDQYFMRNSSRASLTVMISGDGQRVRVDAIGSGGGNEALFRFSWGAEDDFARRVAEILRRRNFTLQNG